MALLLFTCLLVGTVVNAVAAEATNDATDGTTGPGWWSTLSPREKLFVTDAGAAAIIAGWGFATWDYGNTSWHDGSEGWFTADTKEGGADKFGHFYASYALGRGLSALFHRYGYDNRQAINAGALSSLGVMTAMEFGDGYSPYGFAHEDEVMNVAGAGLSWLLATHPALDRKLAVRAGYRVNGSASGDLFTDYERWRYYLTLKLDGFESMPGPLRWLELHAGYFARGYGDKDPANNRRAAFVGIGLSYSRLARSAGWQRTGTFLNYFQPPATVLTDDHELP